MRASAGARAGAVLDAPAAGRRAAASAPAARPSRSCASAGCARATATRCGARRRRPRPRARPPGRASSDRSGAGKSTLAAVLLRFLDYEGVGHARRRADPRPRRRRRAHASSGSSPRTPTSSTRRCARTCCSPAATPSEAELRAALAHARLPTGSTACPPAWTTEAGPGGRRLSGGERRRIALARAELAGFPLLVLDEPGEHLDTPTADAIVADALAARPRHAADHAPARRPGGDGRDRRPRRGAASSSAARTPSCCARRPLRRAGRVDGQLRAQDVHRPGPRPAVPRRRRSATPPPSTPSRGASAASCPSG